MAKATKIMEETVVGITLELTIAEAKLIAAFTGQVCGVGGPQNITTKIYCALDKIGLGFPYEGQGQIRIIPTSFPGNTCYTLEWENNDADEHGNTFHS